MTNREDLEAKTRSYPHLRGLLSLPGGAMMIAAALGNWEWGPLRHAWVFVVCLLAAAGIAYAIKRSYDGHYGRMTSTPQNQRRAALATLASVALVLGGSLLARSEASWSLDLPINGMAAALAVGMLTYHASTVGPRLHHQLIWGAVLVAGLLPVWGGLNLGDTSNAGLVVVGGAAMLSGLFDHRLLAQAFGGTRAHGLEAGSA